MKFFMNPFLLKEENRMLSTYQGLCSTCIHSLACVLRKNHALPVLNCEEFDDYIPLEVTEINTTESILPLTPEKSRVTENKLDHLKGLCSNCENRQTCTYKKPEGGIWHCEEYC